MTLAPLVVEACAMGLNALMWQLRLLEEEWYISLAFK
jgi:hypothetical protein